MKEINKEEKVFQCSCGHCHDYECEKCKEKSFLSLNLWVILRIIMSFSLMIIGLVFQSNNYSLIFFLVSYVLVSYEIFINLIKGFFKKDFLNENFLMFFASVVAFVLGEYFEGVFIVLLYSVGCFLEDFATNNSIKKVELLAGLKVVTIRVLDKNGVKEVAPDEVPIGALIEVRKGDRVPIDGKIMDPFASLDLKALTGESNILEVKYGDEILAGSINVGNSIVIKTTKLYKDSTVEKIVDLVKGASSKKARSQKFISKFAFFYTPIVVAVALLICIVPPFFDGMNFSKWIYKSLSFLVVSCPCALVISVPLAFFVGIGTLAKNGILVKGSNFIDVIARSNTVAFDKTGTITVGNLSVVNVISHNGSDKETILKLAGSLERSCGHPIATAICKACKEDSFFNVKNLNEISGKGVYGVVDNKSILVGNYKLMSDFNIVLNDYSSTLTTVFVCVDNIHIGTILLEDVVKEDALSCISELKNLKVNKLFMLTGDSGEVATKVSKSVGVKNVYYELLPEQKYNILKRIKGSHESKKIVYVGDGINDSPCLALADVGVSMGALGSDEAIEASDICIMDDKLLKIPKIIKHSRKIRRIVSENIFFSICIKLSIMFLSIFMLLPIWISILSDVGLMFLAVLNSMRCYKIS